MKNLIDALTASFTRNGLEDEGGNLHSPEQFRQRLAIEKRRAERLNSTVTVMKLDVGSVSLGQTDSHGDNLVHALAKVICLNTRETDAVTVQGKTVMILLPDTAQEFSRVVLERLRQQVVEQQTHDSLLSRLDFDQVRVTTQRFPETWGGKEINISFDATGGRDRRRQQRNETHVAYHSLQNDARHPREGIQLSSNGAIAVQSFDFSLWDERLVKEFLHWIEKAFKRALDLVGALAGLALLLPLLIAVAIAIKLTSPGPVLFRQKRIGYSGETFTFLKFRSMRNNCDNRIHQQYVKSLIQGNHNGLNHGSVEQPLFKLTEDPRITPIGRFIRKTSIDELPQLWNVLTGEMSLVGPRPPIPYEVTEYQKWHYRRLLEVKPGITGLWQVSGRNRTTFDEMVRLDIHYARNWSLLLDLKILLKTVKVVLIPDGF